MSRRSLSPGYCLDRTHGLAYVRLSGRKHYLGPHGTPESRRKYHELLSQWLQGGEAPMPSSSTAADDDGGGDLTIAELIAAWWKHNHARYGAPEKLDGKRPAGEAGLFVDVFRELHRLFGEHKAAHFGPKALKTLARALAGERRYTDRRTGATIVRQGLSRGVVNGHVSRVKAIFRWAVEEELLAGEISHRLAAVRGLGRGEARETEPTQPVADADVEAVLPFLSRHVAAMVQVQRRTGMRSAELVGMRRSRVDTSGPLWLYKLGTEHKTGHHGIERQIEIGPRAQEILKSFPRRSLTDEYFFSPADAEEERRSAMEQARKTPQDVGNVRGTNRVAWPRRKPGKHYTPASYRRAIQRACDLADLWAKGARIVGNDQRLIERWHPHQLRHSLACEIRGRFSVDAAQVVLGHQSLDVTQLYAKKDQELAARVMLEIG